MKSLNFEDQIGVYIHVPFCQSKCGYCDFYSIPSNSNDPLFEEFTNSVVQEIKLRFKEYHQSRKVRTIFLGGGTPSLLSLSQIKKIVDSLQEFFDLKNVIEFTIEVNPGTVSEKNLKFYKKIGINRISIGIQAFQDHLLRKLERVHTSKQANEAYEFARNANFDNINIDLIFGVPGQSMANWADSLEQAISLNPEHLSIYNLTYESGTPFYTKLKSGLLKAMVEEKEEEFYNFTVDFLKNSNYRRYEISNYCKPDFPCEHNVGYWNYHPYLGFGPSAHSFDGTVRHWNDRDLKKYLSNLKNNKTPNFKAEKLNKNVQLEEWIFLQMRQVTGLNLSNLQDRFELPEVNLEKKIKNAIGIKWNEFLKLENQRLSFTSKGFWLSDEILPKLMNIVG